MTEPREHRLRVTLEKDRETAEAAPKDWKEYYYVEDLVTSFNKDCLDIKKWSVGAASIVAVIGQGQLSYLPLVLETIVALALIFWVTETIWRMNQWAFIRYLRDLEDGSCRDKPGISHGWSKYYLGADEARKKWIRNFFIADREGSVRGALKHFVTPRTALPHLLIVVAALAALPASVRWSHPSAAAKEPQRVEGKLDVRLEGDAARPAGPGR
jgi:hypothetical protein